MDVNKFVSRFENLYRETYARAVRRIRDKRFRLSPETNALLTHLSLTGPITLTDLAHHTSRAASTMSEMVDNLVEKGLLEKETDPNDRRRNLIWLTSQGQKALHNSLNILDPDRLEMAANNLSEEERREFSRLFEKFNTGLKGEIK